MTEIPFERNFYGGPTTDYEVGTTIEHASLDHLFGVIVETRPGYSYRVRVDPSCKHFRKIIHIDRREAIRPEERRVREAAIKLRNAEWDRERAVKDAGAAWDRLNKARLHWAFAKIEVEAAGAALKLAGGGLDSVRPLL